MEKAEEAGEDLDQDRLHTTDVRGGVRGGHYGHGWSEQEDNAKNKQENVAWSQWPTQELSVQWPRVRPVDATGTVSGNSVRVVFLFLS